MNKSQLIDYISLSADLSKEKSKAALNAALAQIALSLACGEEVMLPGFGVFKISPRAARTGRNPATGQPMHIAAANLPTFKASGQLKESCNR
ncbi:HU family DNA-binding protein [Vibrio algivorus]|uniref:HU family DNA-binding protein n=1 Tax=Vibrio algivorus TaxID=1667024 RepID=A0A557PGY4_9VIBR|nr:HU family DNA-binding protein [Vibrio algivorus]TVO39917.1 HU family DNA-binding protein [Vibrio algivorus]